jgi:hypothetical protein
LVADDGMRQAAAATPLRWIASVEFQVRGDVVVIRDRAVVGRLLLDLRDALAAPDDPRATDRGSTLRFNYRCGLAPPSGALQFCHFNPYSPEKAFGVRFWRDLTLVGEARASQVRSLVRRIANDVIGCRVRVWEPDGRAGPVFAVPPRDLGSLVEALEQVTGREFAYNNGQCSVDTTFRRRRGGDVTVTLIFPPDAGASAAPGEVLPPPFDAWRRYAVRENDRYVRETARGYPGDGLGLR